MSAQRHIVPLETLRDLIELDRQSGAMTWKARAPHHFAADGKQTAEHKAANWNKRMAGKPALAYRCPRHGYLTGSLFNRHMSAHRVVFALTHGHWPMGEVDHINGNPSDNRPSNLRDVTHRENQMNVKRQRNNTSGTRGVSFDATHSVWVARITSAGRTRHIGRFATKEEAAAARRAANEAFGFHPNHGRA